MDDSSKVRSSCDAHERMQQRSELPRALLTGTKGMRDKGKEYLPQKRREHQKAWESRRDSTFLDNFYERAISEISEAPFEDPVVLGEEAPEQIQTWAENIDNAGTDLTAFAWSLFRDGWIDGLVHVLADFPNVGGRERTRAEDEREGRRPYLIRYPMADVPRWRWEVKDGKPRLTQVHLVERRSLATSKWEDEQIERVRVFYAAGNEWVEGGARNEAAVEVYEPVEEGTETKWVLVEGPTPIKPHTEIPLETYYVKRCGFMESRPPLEALAWLNLAHWQSSSHQRNVLDWSRFAILFGKMLETDEGGEVVIGPDRLIIGNAPESDLRYVEHGGEAISAGERDLENLATQAEQLRRGILSSAPGQPTATASTLDEMRRSRSARSAARSLSGVLGKALQLMGDYVGIEDVGTVDVDTSFGLSLLGQDELEMLRFALQAGTLSDLDFNEELRRRGIMPAEWDPQAAIDRARVQGPGLDLDGGASLGQFGR